MFSPDVFGSLKFAGGDICWVRLKAKSSKLLNVLVKQTTYGIRGDETYHDMSTLRIENMSQHVYFVLRDTVSITVQLITKRNNIRGSCDPPLLIWVLLLNKKPLGLAYIIYLKNLVLSKACRNCRLYILLYK